VQLKLRPRVKVRRVVALGETAGIIDRFDERIRDGYLYGDYQFATDSTRDSFLGRGVFSCYQPVPRDTPLTPNPTRFSSRRLGAADVLLAQVQAPRLRGVLVAVFEDVGPDLLGGLAALGRVRRQLPRGSRSGAGRESEGDRDDYGDLRAAAEADRVHG
jgi:hypothetical protein